MICLCSLVPFRNMRLDSSGAVPMKLHARLHAINIHERKMGCSFLFHQRYLNKFSAFPILKLLQLILPICYPLDILCGEFMLYGERRERERERDLLPLKALQFLSSKHFECTRSPSYSTPSHNICGPVGSLTSIP